MKSFSNQNGQSLVELLLAIALAGVVIPVLLVAFVSSRQGKVQQLYRIEATNLMKESQEAVRSVREKGWNSFAFNGTYHPIIAGSSWSLSPGSETINGITRAIVIDDVYRDDTGVISASGSGWLDPSTKKIDILVSWATPSAQLMNSTVYVTRYLDSLSFVHTTQNDFSQGTFTQTEGTNTSGGEVTLALNTKAKWCAPALSSITIDLPDGPPVAVDATASANTTIPNDVLVGTSPTATNSVKLAYVTVTANTDPPVPTQQGIFTLDASQYSDPGLVPTGIGLTNSFRTNDVKYFKSNSGKTYALIATDIPNKEVIAVELYDGTPTGAYQDPVNKIYKYKTFFNTRRYANHSGNTPNQDQAPFGYGATSLAVLENRGYISSGGYLYVFDLSNIDSKSPSSGLDMFGCRIQLDGYDCNPGSPGQARKYSSGQSGTSFSDSTSPIHNDCSDGGNIELFATNDLAPVNVGNNKYVYVAIGGVTNPEFEVVNVSTVPSNSRSDDSSCGRISGGDSTWRVIDTLDFNSQSNTEEAANSVYTNSTGTRAYVSSNGGIDGNNNGQADSKQFYVINTSNKSNVAFLSGTSSTGALSGFYLGSSPNDEMYPRRSMTVLNGQRAVLVGKDAIPNGNDGEEYQVLNLDNEASPTYCAGVNFDQGFNDLTSVREADFDTYVYMVANTSLNELKVIQGGPDGMYVDQGTYESPVFDAGYQTAFNRYDATIVTPSNTSLSFQFAVADPVSGSCTGANYEFFGPDGTESTYYTGTNSALLLNDNGSGYENPGRCFKYKAYFSTTDYNATPELRDMTVTYSP